MYVKDLMLKLIVAIGGGSIIDASKAIGIIMTNPEIL